jgi:hypothetical protein
MVLVDTSVFINFFRGKNTKGARALEQLTEGGFCITPTIMQELLQGARDDAEFETLLSYLGTQLFCYPMDPLGTYEEAARIYLEARKRGFTIRSTIDCLIAQIAIEHKIPLLHEDKDFEQIASFSKLKIF